MKKFTKALTAVAAATVLAGTCFAMAGCGDSMKDVDPNFAQFAATEFVGKIGNSKSSQLKSEMAMDVIVDIKGDQGGYMKMSMSSVSEAKTFAEKDNYRIDDSTKSETQYLIKDKDGNDITENSGMKPSKDEVSSYLRNGVSYTLANNVLREVNRGEALSTYIKQIYGYEDQITFIAETSAEALAYSQDEVKDELLGQLNQMPGVSNLTFGKEDASVEYSAKLQSNSNKLFGMVDMSVNVNSPSTSTVSFEITMNVKISGEVNVAAGFGAKDLADFTPSTEQIKEIVYADPATDIAADFKANKAVEISVLGAGALGDNNSNVYNNSVSLNFAYPNGYSTSTSSISIPSTLENGKIKIAADAYKNAIDQIKQRYSVEDSDITDLELSISLDYSRTDNTDANNPKDYYCSSRLKLVL